MSGRNYLITITGYRLKQPAKISLFLQQMKSIVEENGFIFVEREASVQFLADRNMTVAQLEDIILSLCSTDCFDGPEPDRDDRFKDRWTVAEFSPQACGEKLYLKLSIRIDARRCKCLSVKLFSERPAKQHG